MDIKLHKQATTRPKIRAEIQSATSSISDSELARRIASWPANMASLLRLSGAGDTVTMSMTDHARGTICWPRSRPSKKRC